MTSIRTILHPMDFSKQSEFAFHVAGALARDYGAELYIVHVMPPPIAAYLGGPLPVDTDRLQAELLQKLNKFHVEGVNLRSLPCISEVPPVEEILHIAREIRCDLIVMGTHGRTGLGRAFMGSVAEGVVRKAPCPVLTIKNPFPDAAKKCRQEPEQVLQA